VALGNSTLVLAGTNGYSADHDDVSGMAAQRWLRGWRLARAEFRARAVRLGRACGASQRKLHGGRRRLAPQKPRRLAAL